MPLLTQLLHIENDALVARAVARLLRQQGYQVRSIGSCADARDVASQFRVGIFDIDLSDGDGVALAEELSRRGTVTHAVFFTATTDVELRRRARRTGPVIDKAQGASALLTALRSEPAAPCSVTLSKSTGASASMQLNR